MKGIIATLALTILLLPLPIVANAQSQNGVGPIQPSTNNRPELIVQTGHSNYILSIVFSPDGMILASGSQDNTVKLWDVGTGKELRTLEGHTHRVISVAFSPDGKTLASASFNNVESHSTGEIKLWDVST